MSIQEIFVVIKTILVAVDGSNLSEQVIATVENIKLEEQSQIILTYVIANEGAEVEVRADRPHTYGEEMPYKLVEKQLQEYQKRLPCPSQIEIVSGDPAQEIIRTANIYKADLIVLGSRGLTGMKRILLGSVSSMVVADAECSVMVVKPYR